jgi:hypothetical protein
MRIEPSATKYIPAQRKAIHCDPGSLRTPAISSKPGARKPLFLGAAQSTKRQSPSTDSTSAIHEPLRRGRSHMISDERSIPYDEAQFRRYQSQIGFVSIVRTDAWTPPRQLIGFIDTVQGYPLVLSIVYDSVITRNFVALEARNRRFARPPGPEPQPTDRSCLFNWFAPNHWYIDHR